MDQTNFSSVPVFVVTTIGFASNWGLESGWSFNGPVWSVSIEILLYFVFFILAYYGLGHSMICLAVSVIAFTISLTSEHYIFKGLSLFFLGGFVFHSTFLISTKLQILKPLIHYVAALTWLLTIVNFYVFSISVYILKFGFMGSIFLKGFPVYILFPFTVCSLSLIEIDRGHFLKPISWIGDITYSSYILHFPLQLIFGLAVSYDYLNFNFYINPISLIVFFSLLIPLSYITLKCFERPMQKLIRSNLKI